MQLCTADLIRSTGSKISKRRQARRTIAVMTICRCGLDTRLVVQNPTVQAHPVGQDRMFLWYAKSDQRSIIGEMTPRKMKLTWTKVVVSILI